MRNIRHYYIVRSIEDKLIFVRCNLHRFLLVVSILIGILICIDVGIYNLNHPTDGWIIVPVIFIEGILGIQLVLQIEDLGKDYLNFRHYAKQLRSSLMEFFDALYEPAIWVAEGGE